MKKAKPYKEICHIIVKIAEDLDVAIEIQLPKNIPYKILPFIYSDIQLILKHIEDTYKETSGLNNFNEVLKEVEFHRTVEV